MAVDGASRAVSVWAAVLCLAAPPAMADGTVAADRDPLAGLIALDELALATATGGFRVGNLDVGIGAVVRTMIADGQSATGDGGVAATDTYALEPGMSAPAFRLDVPGTTISGLGLATIIENTQSNRAISRQVTLNVEISGLASAIRSATAARAIGAAGPTSRFR